MEKYEDKEIAIQNITREIFRNYVLLAKLEIEKKTNTEEYKNIRKEIIDDTIIESKLYHSLLTNHNFLKRYYNQNFQIPDDYEDTLNYIYTGNIDICYQDRIARQLQRVIHFRKIRSKLPKWIEIQNVSSKEQKEQFTYCIFFLLMSSDYNMNYQKLLNVENRLQGNLTENQKSHLIFLKYYYIFINPKAEQAFLSPTFLRKRAFDENTVFLEKDFLDQTLKQGDLFHEIYSDTYYIELIEQIEKIINRWCQYTKESSFIDFLDEFFKIEIDSILIFLNSEQLNHIKNMVEAGKNFIESGEAPFEISHVLSKIKERVEKRTKEIEKESNNKTIKKEYKH